MISGYVDQPTFTIEQRLDEMRRQFKALPMNSQERGRLALRIVALEDEQEAQHAAVARAELAR